MFGLGIVAARHGGLDPVPDRIRRGCGVAVLGGVAAWGLLSATVAATGVDPDASSTQGYIGPRSPWPHSKVRSPSARRYGCSESRNEDSIVAQARSVEP
jgi:hypothetical protein